MDYIYNFSLHIQDIPNDTFRLISLDCQNDGISEDFVFHLKCFSSESYDISDWGLKKSKIYYKNELFRSGLLMLGKAYIKDFQGYFYEFWLSSPLAYLKTRGPNRVFVNKTPNEIIDEVFKTAGWKPSQWRWELKNPLPVLAYRVQYHQADYDFIMELIAEYKLNFIFERGILKISDNLTLKNITHHVEEHHHYYSKTLEKTLGYEFEKSLRAPLMTAKIEAPDNNSPYINHEGYYYIKLFFDKTSELLHGSLPAALVSPHYMHFPLRNDTEVAVKFIDGNINQPILIGVLPEQDPESDTYVHKSYAGHECILNKNHIKLTHGNLNNFIQLAENTVINSGVGEVCFNAGNQLGMKAYDITQEIQQNQTITVQHNQSIQAHNMVFQSGRNVSVSAENKIHLNSMGNMEWSGDKIQLFSENIKFCAQENIEINSRNKINIFAQNINMNLQGNVLLQVGGVSVVSSGGGMVLNTPTLMINAQQIAGIQMM